jgi:CDP-glucose 4,6-dehydratase
VLDALHGYLVLCEALVKNGQAHAEGWNFGPLDGEARTVSWLIEHLAKLWGDGARWEPDPGVHPEEAPALQLDSAKARARLPWRPLIPLDRSLEWVVEWYRERNRNPSRAGALCRAQIARFNDLVAA